MKNILLISLIALSNFCLAQNKSFWVEQLGLPLKTAISNISKEKQLEPVYVSDYGSVEYKNAPLSTRKGNLTIYSDDSLVYRMDFYFSTGNWNSSVESGTALYNSIMEELYDKYGNPKFSDPYDKYDLGSEYLRVSHWDLDTYVIKLYQPFDSDIIYLTYTYTPLFDKYIQTLLNTRKKRKE